MSSFTYIVLISFTISCALAVNSVPKIAVHQIPNNQTFTDNKRATAQDISCGNGYSCSYDYPTCCGSWCCSASAVCVYGECVVDTSSPPPSDDSGLDVGAIIGIAFGCAAGLTAAIIGIACGVKRRNAEMVSQGVSALQDTANNMNNL